MKIVADTNLPALGKAFPSGFDVITFENKDDLKGKIKTADILICRSTLSVDEQLIDGTQIKIVATATSGTDHINIDALKQKRIILVTAQGANAAAVSDWALSVLANIQHQLSGKCAGIVGAGHVGSMIQKRLSILNFKVLTCDPLRKEQPHFIHSNKNDLACCDVLFVNANLHFKSPHASNNLINNSFLKLLKSHCFIINASRGGIVNEIDLLNSELCLRYCTDVYQNEPNINDSIVNNAHICTPHIAGHTIEAKINAVFQVSKSIHHLCGIPTPSMDFKSNQNQLDLSRPSWRQKILNMYDPKHETSALKKAKIKREIFLKIRKAHLRHSITMF